MGRVFGGCDAYADRYAFSLCLKTVIARQQKRDKSDFRGVSWKRLKEEQAEDNMYLSARSGVVLCSSALQRLGF